MKFKNIKFTSLFKTNVLLKVAALILLLLSAVSITYSWVEGTSTLKLTSDPSTIKTSTTAGMITYNPTSASNTINLNKYVDNYESLFMAPAKSADGKVIKIYRDNNTATNVTTDDIGNNYIEFDFKLKVTGKMRFYFDNTSYMRLDGSDNNNLKVSAVVNDDAATVLTSSEVKNGDELFKIKGASTVTVTIRIWYEGTSTTRAAASFNLLLKGETYVPECPEDVLDGTKVSFYGGIQSNWTGAEFIRILNGSTVTQEMPYVSSKTVTTDNRTYVWTGFSEVDSVNYKLTHKNSSSFSGVPIGENAVAGKFYGAYSDDGGTTNGIATIAATTATTTLSKTLVEANATNKVIAKTTLNKQYSAAGSPVYVYYYGELNGEYKLLGKTSSTIGSSKSCEVELDISALTKTANTTVKIITVIADVDNDVFYKAYNNNVEVASKVYTIKAYSVVNGSSTVSNTGGTVRVGGSGSYAKEFTLDVKGGSNTVVYATPATGYKVTGFYSAATGGTAYTSSGNTCTISNISANKNVYVRFEKIKYSVKAYAVTNGTSSSATGGTVKVGSSTAGATSTGSIEYDSSVSLVAAKKSGYNFDGWYSAATGGNLLSSSATYTISSVTGEENAYARFTTADVWTLRGTFDNWDTSAHTFSGDGTTLTTSLTLSAGTYEFKLHKNASGTGTWYGNTGTMSRSNCSGWTFDTSAGNCTITADSAGTYVFTFDTSNNKLTVTYPAVSNVTITFNDNTSNHWVQNGSAVMVLHDDTADKDYTMTKASNNTTWTVSVPATVTDITFNRRNPDGAEIWNHWSPSDRGTKTTFSATGDGSGSWQ